VTIRVDHQRGRGDHDWNDRHCDVELVAEVPDQDRRLDPARTTPKTGSRGRAAGRARHRVGEDTDRGHGVRRRRRTVRKWLPVSRQSCSASTRSSGSPSRRGVATTARGSQSAGGHQPDGDGVDCAGRPAPQRRARCHRYVHVRQELELTQQVGCLYIGVRGAGRRCRLCCSELRINKE